MQIEQIDRDLLTEIYGGAFSFNSKREQEILRLIAAHRLAALSARPDDSAVERVREMLAKAYRDGATDVHNAWENDEHSREPDFTEAASEYARAAIAALGGSGPCA